MKIGLVTKEYPIGTPEGGVSTYASHMAHGLADRGHEVHVLTLATDCARVVSDGSVTVHQIIHRNLYPNKGRLKEFLRRFEYSVTVRAQLLGLVWQEHLDVVEAHQIGAELFVSSFEPPVPIITRLSTTYQEVAACLGWEPNADVQLSAWMEDQVMLHSQHVISTTRLQADELVRRLPIPPARVSVVPYGVPLPGDQLSLSRSAEVERPPHVLFVGRLERRKGVHTLMHAVPRVLAQRPDVRFSLVGADTYAGAAELALEGNAHTSYKQTLLQQLPASHWPQVEFVGYCPHEQLEEHFATCDLLVAPSLYEAPGLVYLEAMAHGKPVIGCRVGGVSEVVDDRVNGLLVPPEDPAALAEAILELLADADRRHRMGAAGRRLVETQFSVERMVKETLQIFERVVGRSA